jgi:hypothetical protein
VRAARQCLPLAQLCLGCNASGCIFVVRTPRCQRCG